MWWARYRPNATGICFDKRGTGISDPVPLGAIPTIERWMDDITTVIDEVGCKRIVVFGHGASDGAVTPGSTTTPAELISGPLRHEVLTAVGHFPHEEAPELFNELLLYWLKG